MTAQQLLAAGWDVRTVSCYGDEGVEGWEWTAPDGTEYVELGDWGETPPVPAHLE